MILHLARVFEQIDLDLTVTAKRHTYARLEICINGHDTVAEVSFGRWASTHDRPRACHCRDRFRRHMNCMHRGEVFTQQPFGIEQCDRRAAVLFNTCADFRGLFGDVHVNGKTTLVCERDDGFEVIERHSANTVRRHTGPRHCGVQLRRVEQLLKMFEISVGCRLDKASLLRVGFSLISRACIGDAQERDPDADIVSGANHFTREQVRIGVS